MAVVQPPAYVSTAVERRAPGVYRWFWDRLVQAHQGLPVRVTSYWRSPADNARVGGVEHSQHLLGTGIDFVYPDSAIKSAAVSRMRALGLVVIDEGDHIHAQAMQAGTPESLGLFGALGLA